MVSDYMANISSSYRKTRFSLKTCKALPDYGYTRNEAEVFRKVREVLCRDYALSSRKYVFSLRRSVCWGAEKADGATYFQDFQAFRRTFFATCKRSEQCNDSGARRILRRNA